MIALNDLFIHSLYFSRHGFVVIGGKGSDGNGLDDAWVRRYSYYVIFGTAI